MPLPFQALLLIAIPGALWLAYHVLVVRVLMTRTSLNPGFTFAELGDETLDAEERAHLQEPARLPGCALVGLRKLADFAPGSTCYIAMYRWDRERLAVAALVMVPVVGARLRLSEFSFTDRAGISWTVSDSTLGHPYGYPWKRILRYPERPGLAARIQRPPCGPGPRRVSSPPCSATAGNPSTIPTSPPSPRCCAARP